MGHGLTQPPLKKLLRGLSWTVALCGVLLALDRWWLGPPRPAADAWNPEADISDIPGPAGNVLIPPYLPSELSWPPAVVLHQGPPAFAWWLGLRRAEEGPLALWLGVGDAPPPAVLGAVAGCVTGDQGHCPPGWHALSTQLRDGRLLWAVSTLEPEELERVVSALGRTHPVK